MSADISDYLIGPMVRMRPSTDPDCAPRDHDYRIPIAHQFIRPITGQEILIRIPQETGKADFAWVPARVGAVMAASFEAIMEMSIIWLVGYGDPWRFYNGFGYMPQAVCSWVHTLFYGHNPEIPAYRDMAVTTDVYRISEIVSDYTGQPSPALQAEFCAGLRLAGLICVDGVWRWRK